MREVRYPRPWHLQGLLDDDLGLEGQSEEGMTPERRTCVS